MEFEEVEVRHRWYSTEGWWTNVFSLGCAAAALALGLREIVRREVDVGGVVVLAVLLFAAPIAGLAIMLLRAARWWRHGRLMAGPDGLSLVDGDGQQELIASSDLGVHWYSVVFTTGEGYAHAPEPYVVVEGSVTGQPLVLAGRAWPAVGTEFWRALDIEAGEPLEVRDWVGLQRLHPGFHRFGTSDTGIGLVFWMIGCFVWVFLMVGLAALVSP